MYEIPCFPITLNSTYFQFSKCSEFGIVCLHLVGRLHLLSCPVEVLCLGPSGDSSVYRFSRSSSSCLEAGKERSVSGLFLPVWVLRAPCSSQPGDPETRLHTLHATLVSIHQNGTVSPTLGPQSYRIGEKSNLFTPRPNQIGSTPPSYLGKQVKIFRLETATL